jgi:hypothetical protein
MTKYESNKAYVQLPNNEWIDFEEWVRSIVRDELKK